VTANWVYSSAPSYALWLGLLLLARGADLLSTWIATPTLLLEGNPVARRLGWRGGLAVNLIASLGCATIPFAAVIVITTSLLVASRNLQWAWIMHNWGENNYRDWYAYQLSTSPLPLYLACLLGQSITVAAIGSALLLSSPLGSIPCAIGIGMLVYALAVLLYSSLATYRIRRHPPIHPRKPHLNNPDFSD
jgi:hypothetical protein